MSSKTSKKPQNQKQAGIPQNLMDFADNFAENLVEEFIGLINCN